MNILGTFLLFSEIFWELFYCSPNPPLKLLSLLEAAGTRFALPHVWVPQNPTARRTVRTLVWCRRGAVTWPQVIVLVVVKAGHRFWRESEGKTQIYWWTGCEGWGPRPVVDPWFLAGANAEMRMSLTEGEMGDHRSTGWPPEPESTCQGHRVRGEL